MNSREAYRRELILGMASGFAGSLMANPDADKNDPNLVTYCVNIAAGLIDAVDSLPTKHADEEPGHIQPYHCHN